MLIKKYVESMQNRLNSGSTDVNPEIVGFINSQERYGWISSIIVSVAPDGYKPIKLLVTRVTGEYFLEAKTSNKVKAFKKVGVRITRQRRNKSYIE